MPVIVPRIATLVLALLIAGACTTIPLSSVPPVVTPPTVAPTDTPMPTAVATPAPTPPPTAAPPTDAPTAMPTAAPTDTPTLAPEPTAPVTPGASPSASAPPVVWTTTATQYRDMNGQQFEYDCPPDGAADTIWGTDIYTDDSSVCTAAVHVGLITLAEGGSVTFEMRPGRDSYEPSTRNGIESNSWGTWSSSFVLIEP